ncbi:MAG: anaerobic glycerol-3-phosphate dehydrogenase subunit GlpA [Sporolactobacillus sp.]
MRTIVETDVAVIGGGVTGVGVLRDLALRGIRALLIEQGDLGHGTSTRNHGLLHSGCRYAVRDPEAAAESYHENLIIKRTVPGSIEKTGGLFVKLPEDEDGYASNWLASCRSLGIPVSEVPLAEAFAAEPLLNKRAEAVYAVPDAAVDDFTLLVDVAADAVRRGAQMLTYHRVRQLLVQNARVTGLVCRDEASGEETEVRASIVVNAAGPWEKQIAELAGLPFTLINNKGMLVVFNRRFNHRVINRLRMPGDGDIFVPAHDVTIFGTTGINVEDPDDTSLERAELEGMLAIGRALIPTIDQLRIIRAYSGSRPLYQVDSVADGGSGRNVTRGMALIDHEERDGLGGIVSITGGKLTTFRLMAEKTVDLVCAKLGSSASCQTADVAVAGRRTQRFETSRQLSPAARTKLGSWAGLHAPDIAKQLNDKAGAQTICECEQVTWAEIQAALPPDGHFRLGDIRRRTRLGMGPCQGTFCQFRAAALAVKHRKVTAEAACRSLQRALAERKKGMAVVATGETAKQLQLMEAIYRVSLGLKEEEEIAHV